MKALIITVAGTATRFNKDTSRDTLKCLYFQENPRYSLLYQILDKARSLDKYIIVGGYLFEELSAFINCNLQEFKDKIELVYNSHYEDYGSGYSLTSANAAAYRRLAGASWLRRPLDRPADGAASAAGVRSA